jgi:hypothetical protein
MPVLKHAMISFAQSACQDCIPRILWGLAKRTPALGSLSRPELFFVRTGEVNFAR